MLRTRLSPLILLLPLAVFSVGARAQWGIGLAGASACPGGFAPAQGAMSGSDHLNNLIGQRQNIEARIEAKEQQLRSVSAEIARDTRAMGQVLGPQALSAIEFHFSGRRNRVDYQRCRPGDPAMRGGVQERVYRPNGMVGGQLYRQDPNLLPPPSGFCTAQNGDAWDYFAQDGGYVNDLICSYHVPTFVGRPSDIETRGCMDALHRYYDNQRRKVELQTQIAALRADLVRFDDQLDRISDQIADGTFCAWCPVQHRGYSQTASTVGGVSPIAGILTALLGNFNGQNRNQSGLTVRPGAVGGGAPPVLPFPGPGAYPGNPYPAITPGYMGLNNGYYGAMPGGIGRGGMTCGGTNPNFLASPYAQSPMPFINSQANPFSNPYANALGNPSLQNPLLMNGFGPGFGPVLGNGLNGYNPFNPMAQLAALNSPLMAQPQMINPQAPEFLPYLGQNPYLNQMSPFGNMYNPFAMNPYGLNNPSAQRPIFAAGLNGAGLPNSYPAGAAMNNPFAMNNAFAPRPFAMNPFLANSFANPLMMNPYAANGVAMNPALMNSGFAPYAQRPFVGSPYAMNNPFAMTNPYALSNPYAPEFLPYMPASAAGGMFNAPFSGGAFNTMAYGSAFTSPYASPYAVPYGSPLGNFSAQANMMNATIYSIQNSGYFGGSAPAVLPYPGPPAYPGTYGGGPAYNYMRTGGGATPVAPNVIRSW